jgi:Protein of unknown function (DUF3592)
MNNQLFGVISIAVGLGLGAFFVMAMRRMLATRSWSVGRAQVLESYVNDSENSLALHVKYSYIVRGTRYVSDTIAPNNYAYDNPACKASLASMQKMLAPYPVGATVPVYFDPQDPQKAVLTRSESIFTNAIIVLVALIFIVVGFGLMGSKAL